MIVVDPRFTRTAAKADIYTRLRSGTDIPFIWGMLYHIFKNGWETKSLSRDRVYGLDKVKEEVMQWTPERVEQVSGVPEAEVYRVAGTMAKNRPSTVVWCMGQTQHTIGNANTRAMCILQLALGNAGQMGGSTNIFRGHDNVQGATDIGPNPDSLPGYYGIAAGSWKHWCRVWGVDYEWIKSSLRIANHDGKAGYYRIALDRRGARKRWRTSIRTITFGRLFTGAWHRTVRPWSGNGRSDEEARPVSCC